MKALVAVCCNERTIPHETAASLVRLAWGGRVTRAAEAYGFETIDFGWFDQFLGVDDLRNYAVQTALDHDYSHLVFLDADMEWPPDLLKRLLRHYALEAVVSGVYFRKPWPHFPVAFHDVAWEDGANRAIYKCDLKVVDEGEALRPAEMVGMGCALIPLSVVQRIGPAPWFEYHRPVHGYATVTEDVPFCQKVRAANVPIWVDPAICCTHYAAQYVGITQWRSAMRYAAQLEARGELQVAGFDEHLASGRYRRLAEPRGE